MTASLHNDLSGSPCWRAETRQRAGTPFALNTVKKKALFQKEGLLGSCICSWNVRTLTDIKPWKLHERKSENGG
jgi:hypothetical protein